MENKMNKQEIQDFICRRKIVASFEDYDSCDNRWGTDIYEIEGKYWAVNTLNGELTEDYVDKGCIKDQYTPKEVTKKKEVIEVENYYYNNGEKVD